MLLLAEAAAVLVEMDLFRETSSVDFSEVEFDVRLTVERLNVDVDFFG